MLLLWIIYVIFVLFLLCIRDRLLIYALWSAAWKGLTSSLLFVMSNRKNVTFPLVSWVRCGAYVTMQDIWNNRISDGCVYTQIRKGLGMHLVTYSNHDKVPFLLIVPIKGRFV